MDTAVQKSPGMVGTDGMSVSEIEAVLRKVARDRCGRLAIAYRNGSAIPHKAYVDIAGGGDEPSFVLFTDGGRIFPEDDGAMWRYRSGKGALFTLHSIAMG